MTTRSAHRPSGALEADKVALQGRIDALENVRLRVTPEVLVRSLRTALDTMQRSTPDVLRNVEVIMAGFAPGEAARRGLSSVVSEVGPLSHADAVSLMYSRVTSIAL